jgi:uncharacterized RDD family membrane protein YckC
MSCANHAEVEEALRPCARCGRDFCGDCTILIRGRVICADCKDDELRDRLSGVGAEGELADIRVRAVAWLIDWVIFYALGWALRLLPIVGLVAQLITWANFIVYEALMLAHGGQTLGKMAVRIRVVHADGTPLSKGRAWLRAGMRGVFPSILALVDYVPGALTLERTCVHDLVARTRVVKADGPR